MKKLIMNPLKKAIGIAIGTTIGGCVLPRLLFKDNYNATWPPIWKQAVLYFIIGYIAAFIVFFLIDWIKSKMQREE